MSTDDAYVKADSTTIAPKVSGYIAAVLVEDNQPVKPGQVLARIDDRDFKVASSRRGPRSQSAEAAIANKQAALDAQQSAIDAAQATVDLDQANETFAEQDDKRYADLAVNGLRHRAECPAGGLPDRRGARRGDPRHGRAGQCRPSSSMC